jgi:hypothetical protein
MDRVDDVRGLSRRVRLLLAGAAISAAVALVAGIAAAPAPRDRIGLSTGGQMELTFPDAQVVPRDEGTTTSTEASTTTEPRSTTSTIVPGLDLPEIELPDLELPPLELDPEEPDIARGTLWTVDNMPPMEPRYLQQQAPAAFVHGTVRNAHGIGVPGLCVDIDSVQLDDGREPMRLRTAGDGTFATSVPNGLYRVGVIDCRGVVPGLSTTMQHLAIAPGQQGELDLRVGDGAGLRVTVTHPSGAPRADWCVQQVHGDVVTQLGALGSVRTDGNGVVVLGGLQPGRSRIVVSEDCDWANQMDGAASEYVDLVANETGELHLAPWNCVRTSGTNHLSCTHD